MLSFLVQLLVFRFLLDVIVLVLVLLRVRSCLGPARCLGPTAGRMRRVELRDLSSSAWRTGCPEVQLRQRGST